MRAFRFDKLVRDKIPSAMQGEGSIVGTKTLNDADYIAALKVKLLEEAAEISLDNSAEAIKELADLQEVLDCMVLALKSSPADLKAIQKTKTLLHGSFKKRLYIQTVTVQDNCPWIDHYTSNPDRYPELKNSGSTA